MRHQIIDTDFGYSVYKEEVGKGIFNYLNTDYSRGKVTKMFIDFDSDRHPIPMLVYNLIPEVDPICITPDLQGYTFYEESDILVIDKNGIYGNSKNWEEDQYERKRIREVMYCIPLTIFKKSR